MASVREALLNARVERARRDVTSLIPPAWAEALQGKKLYLREMTAVDRTTHIQMSSKDKALDELVLVLLCLVDEENDRVFTPDDLAVLNQLLPSYSATRLISEALEINGFFYERPR